MNCPDCISEMTPISNNCKAVNYCPQCKGMWLGASLIKHLKNDIRSKTTEEELATTAISDLQLIIKDDGSDYYYYKKEYIQNGKLDDLFDFEYD